MDTADRCDKIPTNKYCGKYAATHCRYMTYINQEVPNNYSVKLAENYMNRKSIDQLRKTMTHEKT